MQRAALNAKIKQQLETLGLECLGFALPDQPSAVKNYKKWIQDGNHAEMSYLERGTLPRENPDLVHPSTEFVVVVGFRYGEREVGELGEFARPRIAQYGRLKDYHKFMRKKLDGFSSWLENQKELGASVSCRPTVDSAPVLERAMAASTMSGFIGKNTCFIHDSLGSFLLLAEVFVSGVNLQGTQEGTLESAPVGKTSASGCGSCRRCQVHCPTGALDEDYRLDARKCLAYWSIEHRGPVPLEFWPYFKDFAFGCDICQNVCPKNRPVVAKHGRPELSAYQKLGATLDLEKVLGMNQKDYEELFGGTPLTRAKFVGLKRNAIIASVAMADTDEKIQELTSTWQDRHLASWKLEDDAHKTLQKTFEMIEGYKA